VGYSITFILKETTYKKIKEKLEVSYQVIKIFLKILAIYSFSYFSTKLRFLVINKARNLNR